MRARSYRFAWAHKQCKHCFDLSHCRADFPLGISILFTIISRNKDKKLVTVVFR